MRLCVLLAAIVLGTIGLTDAATEVKKRCVPFKASIVGKRFFAQDDCYRPHFSRDVIAYNSVIVYRPYWSRSLHLPFYAVCRERYVFHFRRRDVNPYIIYFKPVLRETGQELSEKECVNLQTNVTYRVWGNSRDKFIASVQKMVTEIAEIRDHVCPRGSVPANVKGPNWETDTLVNYLLSVAYSNFFCAQ